MSPTLATHAHVEALHEAIRTRTARVAIAGLGYVGLPLARAFVEGGFAVLGHDVDVAKVDALLAGRSYMAQLPDAVVAEMRAGGRFRPSADPARFAEADAILICVPTPLGKGREPDLSYVEATARAIRDHLRPGQLVVLESTTWPGTTDEVVRPILEEGGLVHERDFYLAYSPEREDPGNPVFRTRTIPKVVGGVGPRGHALACALYAAVVDEVVPVSGSRVAEASKILENTYRAVNIALVNELKVLFDRMGIDIWDVIDAARTKPFGFQPFYPGPGLGGHCIPIDPFYLSWLARRHGTEARFIDLAGRVNTDMPAHVVSRIEGVLAGRGLPVKDSRILVLGIAYKADIDDTRESPAFPIIGALGRAGARVQIHDPFFDRLPRKRDFDMDVACVPLTREVVEDQDCVVIVTAHSAFDYAWLVEHAAVVVDTRGATRHLGPRPNVHRA